MLVVTSSEGVLHGILGHTPHLGPLVPLHTVLVVGASGLEDGLIGTASSGDNADLGAGEGGDGLLSATGKADTGVSLLLIVGDDNSVVSTALSELSPVSGAGLDIANDGTLGHGRKRKDVSNSEGSLLSAVDELSSVHTLGGDDQLVVL